ncbi:MAG TPA: HAD-IIB family hydrolase [Candidatus Paceibacterota bacterium]
MIPAVVIFDLDKTLAASKQPITPAMAEALTQLLTRTNVAIITGGKFEQLTGQAADLLPEDATRERLYLLPTSGAALYEYHEGTWQVLYEERLTEKEVQEIEAAMEEAIAETDVVDTSVPSYGPRIENRGTQVALSALGQQAPVGEKEAWDPERTKRLILRDAIAAHLPDYSVKTGGASTIDVTKKGVDKAFGVRKLAEHLSLPVSAMLYVGDALYPLGNDEVVIQTGIPTRQVSGPEETLEVIGELLDASQA